MYIFLGKMIAKKRKSLGLTQAEFSKKIKIHRVTLAKIETGKKRKMTLEMTEALLRMSGMDWFDFASEFLKQEIEEHK